MTDRLHELIEMRSSQMISDEEFTIQRDRLRRQIIDVQAKGQPNAVTPLTADEAAAIVKAFSDVPGLWARLALLQKQAFGRSLFPTGYQFQRIRTTENGLLFRVFGGLQTMPSHVVDQVRENPNAVTAAIRGFLATLEPNWQPSEKAA